MFGLVKKSTYTRELEYLRSELRQARAKIQKGFPEARAEGRQGVLTELAHQLKVIPQHLVAQFVSLNQTGWLNVRRYVQEYYQSAMVHQKEAVLQELAQVNVNAVPEATMSRVRAHATAHRERIIEAVAERGREEFLKELTAAQNYVLASAQRAAAQLQARTARAHADSADFALPTGTRFCYGSPQEGHVFVVEQPPTVRTLRFGGRRIAEPMQYRLALPFMVFLVHANRRGEFSRLKVYCRNARLCSASDALYSAPLPNTYNEHSVCLPELSPSDRRLPLTEMVERVLDIYWASPFNRDLEMHYQNARSRIDSIRTLDEWQSNTRQDPGFVLRCIWPKANENVAGAVRQMLGSDYGARDAALTTLSHDITVAMNRLAESLREQGAELFRSWRPEETLQQQIDAEIRQHVEARLETLKSHLLTAADTIIGEAPTRDEVMAYVQAHEAEFAEQLEAELTLRLTNPPTSR